MLIGPAGKRGRNHQGLLGTVRVRIITSYVVLLALFGIASAFALREGLIMLMEERVDDALTQEVSEVQRLLADGRDPNTGEPFGSDLEGAFDKYISRNVPERDEAFGFFVGGQAHRWLRLDFDLQHLPAAKVAEWERLSAPTRFPPGEREGTFETDAGRAYYKALPVRIGGSSGAFVITILPIERREDVSAFWRTSLLITLLLILVASVLGWFLSRRVLTPVRLLTDTARSISQMDLTRRISVPNADQETVEMARTFNQMLDRLETTFRSQRKFLEDTSHELRVPLTISIGQLELLAREQPEHEGTALLVIDELERASNIVDDLRVLAEAEDPAFLRLTAVKVRSLMGELLAKSKALAPRSWMVEQEADGTILADRERVTQAFMNLAQNAVEHTEQGDVIALGSETRDGELHLWVRDSGPGVPPEDRERILERFQRGRDARRRYRGAGLGLAITRAIAEAHGGRIEIESEPGKGTTVTVVIPERERVEAETREVAEAVA